MSRLEKIEAEIERMSPDELEVFRAWFTAFDAECWDRQFEADAKDGKQDKLAARALRDHEAGRTAKL